jgi:hypothetical protein
MSKLEYHKEFHQLGEDWKFIFFRHAFDFFLNLIIIFGPIVGYIPQYFQIKRSNSVVGFSSKISLILLSANILRIFYWFLEPFELPLLFQAALMIATQLVLLHCIVAKRKFEASTENLSLIKPISLLESKPKESFWEWSSFKPYVLLISFYVFTCFALTVGNIYIFTSRILAQMIGYAALMIESTLGIPQFISNYRRKSVSGLCRTLVLMWLLGDIGKTALFLYRKTKPQFILCGIGQTIVDIGIFLQLLYYRTK